MTDVFLSYAHDDQAFARAIAQNLEAEGLSVWWDHTIPPGKTWDTHIAAGIEAARACVVIWSKNSVDSDWVKEEATMARDADKFLPIALDDSLPPVGFRRIQAARLAGWTGDRNHPHWRLLVGEVRNLIHGRVTPPPPALEVAAPPGAIAVVQPPPPPIAPFAPAPIAHQPPPQSTAPMGASPSGPTHFDRAPPPSAPAPTAGAPVGRIVAVAAVVAGLAVAGYFGFTALNRPAADLPVTAAAPVAEAAAPATPAVDTAEAERLRQERDAALAQAQEAQRLADERNAEAARLEEERRQAERQRQQEEERRRQSAQAANMTGVWDGEIRWSTGSTAAITWEYFSDGSMLTSFGSIGSWRANGQSVTVEFDVGARYDGTLRNGVYSGNARSMEGDPGTFEMWRR